MNEREEQRTTRRKRLWVFAAILLAFLVFFVSRRQMSVEEIKTIRLVLPKFGKIGEYRLSYARKVDPNFSVNPTSFEKGEDWRGNGIYDSLTFYEGSSSMLLISNNHFPGTIYLEKRLNLKDYAFFDVLVYVPKGQLKNIESLDVKFGDASLASYYQFRVSNLSEGWNFIRMPQYQFLATKAEEAQSFDWSQIEKIEFVLLSRPGTAVGLNLDALRAERDLSYLSDWEFVDENFLGIDEMENKAVLLARNVIVGTTAVLKLADVKDFTFQASVSPQKPGGSGLFFRGSIRDGYGYYFLIDGLNGNGWRLFKIGVGGMKMLREGQIGNITFSSDEKYWLKVKAKGNLLKVYLSRDGENFSQTASVVDTEFSFGKVGIAALDQTFSFFDDFYFKKE